MATKTCGRCKQALSVKDFAKNVTMKSGFSNRCLKCTRKHYQENKHNWHYDTEKHRERSKQWKLDNPDKVRVTAAIYRKTHAEKMGVNNRRRRGRKNSIGEYFTVKMALHVRNYWGNTCAICGISQSECKNRMPIDHWLPLSKGHGLSMSNAVLLCQPCNTRKLDRYPWHVYDSHVVAEVQTRISEQVELWFVASKDSAVLEKN